MTQKKYILHYSALRHDVNPEISQVAARDQSQGNYPQVLVPVLRKFAPELILVSAGYDAHWQDPLAGLCLSCQGQAWLSQNLVALADELCQGRIVFSLDGGYDVDVLSHGVANSMQALLG